MALVGAGLGAATTAQADTYVDGRLFGLHVPQIANGAVPSVAYGSIRLWDSGIAWGMVEQGRGRYWWAGLDRAIAAASAQHAEIVYVLGSTPRWAATHTYQGTYPNRGAASNPKVLAYWKEWVTAVVRRHGASIDAYQIWNEANLATFWQGTARQMAILTLEAKRIIRRYDPSAKVVAASSTMRLTTSFSRFFPAYLTELRRVGWPVDVFAIHTYGPSTAAPAIREVYVARARARLKAAGAPARPLWDTEINYGIKGPGAAYPDVDIEGAPAAADVAQTYLDSIRLRLARTYWYAWSPPTELLGITMFDATLGAIAYQTTHAWVSQASVGCTSAAVRVCRINRSGQIAEVAWTSAGAAGAYVVPPYATRQCDALDVCTPAVGGSTVMVGRMPMWFGP
ncbi:MAG: hypothetical protein PHU75_04735 [Candidatus Nanopelagicales bacterium]|nr:hypothetical protein [Candidatus Nanopelagicales bacterium]